jgi:Velvet factor
VKLIIQDEDKTSFQNPYIFVVARLVNANTSKPANRYDSGLTGSICSSLHNLRVSNEDCGVFAFGGLFAKAPGVYKLCFTLFEMRLGEGGGLGQTEFLAQTYSNSFEGNSSN